MCQQTYTDEAWHDLATVQVLEPVHVKEHVLTWPAERVVDVRTCLRCGRAMARLRPMTIPPQVEARGGASSP